MLFADHTQIMPCTGALDGADGIRGLGNSVAAGHRIHAALIADHAAFLELIKQWILPWAARMREADAAVPPEQTIKGLFFPNGDPAAQRDFLARLTRFIQGCSPYETEIWPQCPADDVLDAVDSALEDAPAYMRLRVQTVCLMCGFFPDAVFSRDLPWSLAFLPDRGKAELLEVQAGDTFSLVLSFRGNERLTPKTLHNGSGEPCVLRVRYGEEEAAVTLPPHGILRAVFSDAACTRLACVKGNVSLNGSEAENALIQLSTSQGPRLYMSHAQAPELFPLALFGPYLDAAVNGRGGVQVLYGNGIYDTLEGQTQQRKPLPIRLYGAGPFWAEQYADGSLKTNMTREGRLVERAWAIVEDGDRCLLFADTRGTWRCGESGAAAIDPREFARCMLARFQQPGCAECLRSEALGRTLRIGVDGRLT